MDYPQAPNVGGVENAPERKDTSKQVLAVVILVIFAIFVVIGVVAMFQTPAGTQTPVSETPVVTPPATTGTVLTKEQIIARVASPAKLTPAEVEDFSVSVLGSSEKLELYSFTELELTAIINKLNEANRE